MKKTTRFLALALSVLMLLGALAGCAASTTEPENTPAQDSAKTEQTAQTETTDNTAEPAEAPVEVSIAIWGAEDALANPDDPILKQLEEKEPLPDKEKDQMAWVRAANQHRAIAEEIILKELIYV